MKKLVFGLIATVMFGSLSYGQRELSDEQTKSLQEILNKVSRIAEEKGKIVSFDLSYDEAFQMGDYTVDEEGKLAKELTSSYGEKFNDLKGKVKIDCPQLFELGNVNGVGNAVIKCSRAKGFYVPKSFGGGDEQDLNFNKFFESSEFAQLSKEFSIKLSDIDRINYDFIDHESKKFKVYRVLDVNKNSITFFTDDDGESYALAYENDDLEKGIAEHLDEYGNLYATFTISKNTKGSYSYKIDKIYSPETTGNPTNKKACSVTKVYATLKAACESDAFCDMMCDLPVSFCHGMLMHWAVAFCATRN